MSKYKCLLKICLSSLSLIGLIYLFSVKILTENFSVLIPLTGFFIIAMTMINYYKAAFTEPGFLPRGTPFETNTIESKHKITLDLSGQYFPEPKPLHLNINKCDYLLNFCVSKKLA